MDDTTAKCRRSQDGIQGGIVLRHDVTLKQSLSGIGWPAPRGAGTAVWRKDHDGACRYRAIRRTPALPGLSFRAVGGIHVIKRAANGRELPLYRVLPGDSCIMTSSCLLGQADYNACGITESDTELVFLPKPAFDLLLTHAPFRIFVFRLFAERIGELMQLVEEVAFQKLDQRLANLLLGRGKLIQTTHQQLADELGSVREMVSRLLKGFAEQGLVRLGREQIEILDPAGLRKLSA